MFCVQDESDWRDWQKVGDPVLHIELRRWADIFVIAPLSANTLAKMANGMCDNLLTCIVRAWDFKKNRLLVGGSWQQASFMQSRLNDVMMWAKHHYHCVQAIATCPCVPKGAQWPLWRLATHAGGEWACEELDGDC